MEDINVCRVCLITNVKMFNLEAYPLNIYFSSLGCNHLSVANSHPYACYECAELLRKYYHFRQKCLQTRIILNGLIDHSGKINSLDLNRVDRAHQLLATNLSKCIIPNDRIQNIVHSGIVKEETDNDYYAKSKNVYDIENFKEESVSVLLSGDQHFCSDDDEPLSLHKKIKEDDEVQVKEDSDVGDADFTQEPFINLEADELSQSPPPLKKKRGRPKKAKSLKKQAKPDHGKSFMDNRLDFEDYITVINLSVEEQLEEINKRKESANYLNATYKCDLCYKGFIDTDAWKHHVSKHSPSNGDIECPICKFRFKTNRDYQKHTTIHEKKYACKSCPYISCNTTQAKQHQGWHKGVTYKCKYCDDVFTIWTSYMSHVRIKHPSEFICGICGYSFVSKLGLAMHKSMMHKDNKEKGEDVPEDGPYCEACDVKFISVKAYKRHMIMSTKHTKDTTIISNGCRTCGETFDTSEECRLHHRKEHARKRPRNYGKSAPRIVFPAKCEHCTEMIPNGREHWAHYRRAHPDKKYPIQKNYVCDICGKSFRGNAFLLYHKRTHSDERAYKCAACGKAFHNRHNLHVHEKTHSDARPHPCPVCLKAFKVKAALDRHYRIHTGQKPYECEVCGKAFTQSNSRKLHVITVHLKQPTPYNSRRRSKNAVKETQPQQFIY